MRLLDLFCGAGGAAKGYYDAGFDEITGVDNRPQPRYPYRFVLGDALEYVAAHGREFDAIHASPPCQGYSALLCLPWLRGRVYPKLIAPLKPLLQATGRPWVAGLSSVVSASDCPCTDIVSLNRPRSSWGLLTSNIVWSLVTAEC